MAGGKALGQVESGKIHGSIISPQPQRPKQARIMDAKASLARRAGSNDRLTKINEHPSYEPPGFGGNPMGAQLRLSTNQGLITDKLMA